MSKASAREISGVTASVEGQAFNKRSIENFKIRATFKGTEANKPKHIGVFVDPNAAGSSHMAIITVCQVNGATVVCGIDSYPVKNSEQELIFFFKHIESIRNNMWLRSAYIILFTERGTGHESGHLADLLKARFDRVACFNQPSAQEERRAMKEIKEGKKTMAQFEREYNAYAITNPGFRTDTVTKNGYRVAARTTLFSESVFWLDGCICANPFMTNLTSKEKFKKTSENLYEQLNRARTFNRRPVNEISVSKCGWSAKCNEEGERQDGYEDDLVVIFAASCFYWSKAMVGELCGFPYSEVEMLDLTTEYMKTNRDNYLYKNKNLI